MKFTPPKVSISIENLSTSRDAFYNLCFITENDESPRTVIVKKLKDLLDSGYNRSSLAYNFCVGVFLQNKLDSVIIRAKRSNESYEQAYEADSNQDFYYLVLDTKDRLDIKYFSEYLEDIGDLKLLFYSDPERPIKDIKAVHYLQPYSFDSNFPTKDFFLNKAYRGIGGTVDEKGAQSARLAYPEAAWIAVCANEFPSHVQWLYKYLAKTDVVKGNIPLYSTASQMVHKNKATIGSATTSQGIVIHEQVGLDWLSWALSRKVWSNLYNSDKLSFTKKGVDLVVNDIKQVLDVAVTEGLLSWYRVTGTELKSGGDTIGVTFDAQLTQSILNAEVSGSLSY